MSTAATPTTGDPLLPRRGSYAADRYHGRRLGIDIESAQELGRNALDDAAQLRFAAEAGRCLVTRNARDFYRLSITFERAGLSHAGVRLLSRSFRGDEYALIATVLMAYSSAHPDALPAYFVDYLHPDR